MRNIKKKNFPGLMFNLLSQSKSAHSVSKLLKAIVLLIGLKILKTNKMLYNLIEFYFNLNISCL